jgi:hypothetical protein
LFAGVWSNLSFLSRAYAANRKSVSNLYAPYLSSSSSQPTGGRHMLDLIYLALGLGLFGLMSLYARWAAGL